MVGCSNRGSAKLPLEKRAPAPRVSAARDSLISHTAENRTGPQDPGEKPAGTLEWKQSFFYTG